MQVLLSLLAIQYFSTGHSQHHRHSNKVLTSLEAPPFSYMRKSAATSFCC